MQIELPRKRCRSLTKVIEVKKNGPNVFIDDNSSMTTNNEVEQITIPSDMTEILDRVENAD